MKFPSLEWAEELCNEINNIEIDEMRSWNWDILFILRNVKNNDMKFKVIIKAGKCLGVEEGEDADYIIEGDYKIWKSILLNELDLAVALLTGKLKLVKGDKLNLLRHIRAAVNIANIIRTRGLTSNLEIM
ncbi:hypothetical protein J5U23_02280 [Saccharolobus shibatae B12]|uniref:SCP2 domain-containing protein n=1 Tax=Saccharolobus shibatae (strain ATCC 51178 / DSM 5389 / JCM 8931 / NBRC 15437 / B12) TaxID=523848 RepID=A0A8F5BQE9_SACSH|nr:SCP2 sterol-binding domain-containing protein [Saccharolobus shibatae]QXJ29411.1 hypothetical protein J5U23_02280 [Saccharolobus shibatae B12]